MHSVLDIYLGYKCNNKCLFCCNENYLRKTESRDTSQIFKILEDAKEDFVNVGFTGGEPTIRGDFVKIVQFTKNLGFPQIRVISNGRMFSYNEFLIDCLKAGLNHFVISLHGHNSRIHDKLTCVNGSFSQTIKGMRNIIKAKKRFSNIKLYINTTIIKPNLNHLSRITQFVLDEGADGMFFVFVNPEGRVLENFDSLVPKMTDAIRCVQEAVNLAEKYEPSRKVLIDGFPLCILDDLVKYSGEIQALENLNWEVNRKDTIFKDFVKVRKEAGKRKSPLCVSCSKNNICEGAWKNYARKIGLKELKPI